MASVDWQKATLQKAGAMKKHNGKEERLSGNHSNEHIDKSKSHLNVYIGADDYSAMLEKVKARIKDVDERHPPKRDMGDRRITCMLLETPVPQEITEQGRAEEFLRKAHSVIEGIFGAENVGGTCGHFDEQHYYFDKDGKERLSLVHGHTLCAAYAEWEDKRTGELRKGINGKNCETKARLTAMNKAMCEMCMREYGIEYNTAETPQRKSVETLKQESAVRQEVGELTKSVVELQKAEQESRRRFLEADEAETEARMRAEAAEKRAANAEQRATAAEHKLEEANAKVEIATQEAKAALDKAAKASEITSLSSMLHRVGQTKNTVTYNENMLDDTRAIGNKAYEHLKKANQIKQEAVTIQQRAERKEKEIEPLYQQASAAHQQAQGELSRARKMKEQEEQLIEQKAEIRASEMVREIMQSTPTKERDRMRRYMESLQFGDGTTALERFEEQEQQLHKKLNRGFQR